MTTFVDIFDIFWLFASVLSRQPADCKLICETIWQLHAELSQASAIWWYKTLLSGGTRLCYLVVQDFAIKWYKTLLSSGTKLCYQVVQDFAIWRYKTLLSGGIWLCYLSVQDFAIWWYKTLLSDGTRLCYLVASIQGLLKLICVTCMHYWQNGSFLYTRCTFFHALSVVSLMHRTDWMLKGGRFMNESSTCEDFADAS